MRIYYITLNTPEEASRISRALLEQRLAVCTNWFPLPVPIGGKRRLCRRPNTNFIGEIAPESVNESFLKWLSTEVPVTPQTSHVFAP